MSAGDVIKIISQYNPVPRLIVLLACKSEFFAEKIRAHSRSKKFSQTHLIYCRKEVSVEDEPCTAFLNSLSELIF